MGAGRVLGAKLLLEGKEVPFIGATITHTVNQAAIAYIDLVPHKEINQVKPRTLAQVFVRNYNAPSTGGNLHFPYVLAFEGEVFGFNFGRTPSSRTFSISCIDYSNYWDNVVTYFFNAMQSMGKGAAGLCRVGFDLSDAEKQGEKVTPVTHSTASYFIQLMRGKTDFLDGLVEVIRNVTKLNTFYQNAQGRLRINDRIRLKSSGELNALLAKKEASQWTKWMEGIIGRTNGMSTLRMVIQDLMSIVFHDFVSVPFPAKVASSNLSGPAVKYTGTASSKTIGNFIFKPNLYMVAPPSCNIFFPNEYSSFQYSRNFFQEPTRLIYKPEMMSFGGRQLGICLPHHYMPPSFDHFMRGKGSPGSDVLGSADIKTNQNYGHIGDPDPSPNSSATNQGKKREAQFLTNEEKMRGILTRQEGMVPAATQFRSSMSKEGKRAYADGVSEYLFYKKRFQGRKVQITSHLKLSVVPGFTTLILDNSDSDQSVVAYCSSVTHRVYATQGGFTNTTLSYARTIEEQDVATGKDTEPPVPPWFSSAIFGGAKDDANRTIFPNALSTFYASLLGSRGSKSIPHLMGTRTVAGAARALIKRYNSVNEQGQRRLQTFIANITDRDYVTMRQAMKFLGAGTSRKDLTTPFVEFYGARLRGEGAGDASQIRMRRSVIDKYRHELKTKRGFRG